MKLAVALQEWAAICELLGSGGLMLAVRKGGIHERGGGLFALDYERFALLPTYLHQDAARLRGGIAVSQDPAPGRLRLSLWAEAARIWRVDERARLDGLDLPWTAAELDARFAYRNQPLLFVVALRVHRLPAPVELADHAAYAGCRSWLPLREQIEADGSTAAIDDAAFAARLAAIDQHLNARTMTTGTAP
jgi:hypothetical protein